LGLGRDSRISLQWRDMKPPSNQQGGIEVRDISTTTVELEHGEREAAVRLRLLSSRQEDWRVEGASLTAGDGQPPVAMRVLSDTSIPAGTARELDMMVGPTQEELTGTYTLRLWGGGRELTLENITFP